MVVGGGAAAAAAVVVVAAAAAAAAAAAGDGDKTVNLQHETNFWFAATKGKAIVCETELHLKH